MARLTRLFEPAKIGRLEVRNRLVMAPMGTRSPDRRGYATRRTIDYYAERAKGGVGLIIVEVHGILANCNPPYFGCVCDDTFVPPLRELTDAVHTHGSKIALQLSHPGVNLSFYQSTAENPEELDVAAPSAIPFLPTGVTPRELSTSDVHHLVETFAEAARRAQEAGFDAVEFHGAHGYLISEFLSPFTNKRKDEYGGSVENRARFACEIVARARERVGADFPIILRVNGEDGIPGGKTLQETLQQAALFVNAGVDALHISFGMIGLSSPIPAYIEPPGVFVHLAEAVKRAVDVPVIAVGKLGDPLLAERILEEGKADFIALGRPLWADPELPNKAKEGRLDDIVRCIYCTNCMVIMKRQSEQERARACTVNPAVFREREFILRPAAEPKNVMVIGGGLAGMQAAKVLAERGHRVSLYERGKRLGGQWNIACQEEWKREYATFTRYLTTSLDRLGVRVTLNKEITPAFVRQAQPDVVVLATGAAPATLDVPGANGRNVVQANDVLMGSVKVGEKVVVIGGRLRGMETAGLLAKEGKKVSLVTRRRLGRDIVEPLYVPLRDRLMDWDVRIFANSAVLEISEEGVSIASGTDLLFLRADTVVLAVGSQPQDKLAKELEGLVSKVYAVGDCVEPRSALEAVNEAAGVGLEV